MKSPHAKAPRRKDKDPQARTRLLCGLGDFAPFRETASVCATTAGEKSHEKKTSILHSFGRPVLYRYPGMGAAWHVFEGAAYGPHPAVARGAVPGRAAKGAGRGAGQSEDSGR